MGGTGTGSSDYYQTSQTQNIPSSPLEISITDKSIFKGAKCRLCRECSEKNNYLMLIPVNDPVLGEIEAPYHHKCYEEEQQESKETRLEKIATKESKKDISKNPSTPQITTSYQNIEFEPHAHYKTKGYKQLFFFDNSLERLRKAGYERHPLPAEVFSLIIDVLEGKATPQMTELKKDMILSYGEWFDLVMKCENGVLHCYEHPRNVIRLSNSYDCSQMTFTQDKNFSLNGLPPQNYILIKDVAKKNPELIKYLYTRQIEKLPSEIQNNVYLWLPESARPVGRSSVNYDVDGGSSYWASRGVRPAKKIIQPQSKKHFWQFWK